jgi:hypothetical protein
MNVLSIYVSPMYPHLNIHNSSTLSHSSEEENRTKNRTKNNCTTKMYNFQKLSETTSLRCNKSLKISFLKGTDRCSLTSLRKGITVPTSVNVAYKQGCMG